MRVGEESLGALEQHMGSDPAITAFLEQQVADGVFAGAMVGVANAEGVVSRSLAGMADREAGRVLRFDDLFWIASMSKTLCACAALMLVDEGRLGLDDAVEQHLPAFRGQQMIVERAEDRLVIGPSPRPITVRQCLSHTSGLPFLVRAAQGRIDTLSLAEWATAAASTPLERAPGSGYGYSNSGTNVVGRLVEVVSGRPYPSFVAERLLRPLGMHATTFWPRGAALHSLPAVYGPLSEGGPIVRRDHEFLTHPYDDPRRQAEAGGGYFSTLADMLQFGRMLLRGGELEGRRYLSAAAVAEMSRKQTGAAPERYGLGAGLDDRGFGHGGAAGTNLWVSPASGFVCVYHVHCRGYGGSGNGSHLLPWIHAQVFGGDSAVGTAGLLTRGS
jgi:CubicO group peptidase (beta-lactamase class C family)